MENIQEGGGGEKGEGEEELQISSRKVKVTGHKVRIGNVVNNIMMTLYGVSGYVTSLSVQMLKTTLYT